MRGRSTLPLLSRVPTPSRSPSPLPIPTIRLVEATPSPDASAATETPPSAVLAPSASPRRRLVPKKSRLTLLAPRAANASAKGRERERDLSDIVRRVADWSMEDDGACNVTVNGGSARPNHRSQNSAHSTIDISVDPAEDPDIGEIVVVKKKKSRPALDGIRWPFGDVTNNGGNNNINNTGDGTNSRGSTTKDKEGTEKLKIKVEEKDKWWTISRGRKEKEKDKDKEKAKEKERERDKDKDKENSFRVSLRRKVPSASAVPPTAPSIIAAPPRERNASAPFLAPPPSPHSPNSPNADCFSAHPAAPSFLPSPRERTGSTPALLQVPLPSDDDMNAGGGVKGSIALRAMKSLARIGSWAQLRNNNREKEKDKEKDREKYRSKGSSSSWEVGAPSSTTVWGEDTTRSCLPIVDGARASGGGMATLGLGYPTSAPRYDSNATAPISVSSGSASTRTGLSVPVGERKRMSVSSEGSAYSASGEDTGVTGGKKGAGSVRWADFLEKGRVEKDSKRDSRHSKRDSKDSKRDSKDSKRDSKDSKRDSKRDSKDSKRDSKDSKRDSKDYQRDSKESKRSSRDSKGDSKDSKIKPSKEKGKVVEKDKDKDKDKDKGKPVEGRRRTPVTSVFPGLELVMRPSAPVAPPQPEPADVEETEVSVQVAQRARIEPFRVVMPRRREEERREQVFPSVKEEGEEEAEMPPVRPRPRPASEQMLGTANRGRPRGIIGSVELQDAALSELYAANSDLASLIKRLDLEATPESRRGAMSWRDSYMTGTGTEVTAGSRINPGEESPLKMWGKGVGVRESVASLRPYGIAPAVPPVVVDWMEAEELVNPPLPVSKQTVSGSDVGRPIVPRAQLSDGKDAAAPSAFPAPPASQAPLPPTDLQLSDIQAESNIRKSSPGLRARAAPFISGATCSTFGTPLAGTTSGGAVSSKTFGKRFVLPSVKVPTSPGTPPTPSPRAVRRESGDSGLVPFQTVRRAVEKIEEGEKERRRSVQETPTRRMGKETRRALGWGGTLGEEEGWGQGDGMAEKVEGEGDIPGELQVILDSQSGDDDTGKMGRVPTDVGSIEDTLTFDDAEPLPSPPPRVDVSFESLSAVMGTGAQVSVPPSQAKPPTAPLPTPSSTPGLIALEPSPPAPVLMPMLASSPSPSPPSTLALDEGPLLANQSFAYNVVTSDGLQTMTTAAYNAYVLPPPRSEDGASEADGEGSASASVSSDDTNPSFDFTGELARLNESGAAQRRSFVEQLESAFRTPAPVRLDFPGAVPLELGQFLMVGPGDGKKEDLTSKASYGRLDKAFKFGGRPQPTAAQDKSDDGVAGESLHVPSLQTSASRSPLPASNAEGLPPRHVRASSISMVEEDSSVLRSIYTHAGLNQDIHQQQLQHRAQQPSISLESDTSSKRRVRADAQHVLSHARSASDGSFSGMSSFGALRTKFEFAPDQPKVFPASLGTAARHARHESLFSIASESSYGQVIDNGKGDPFGYGQLQREVAEEGMEPGEILASLEEGPRHRQQRKRFSTDSDASGFYFRAPHGRNQSVVSTTSGPPISLYNRSFASGAAHKRNDSTGSASSIANAYGMHGASGGRAAWARHHQNDRSIDSVMSEYSAMRLGRPGVGDKMFESALAIDHGPLTSISASPPESVAKELTERSSYDSILDGDQRSTIDSIFDNTGQRSSMSSDSVFGYDGNDPARGNLFPPTQFRPLSIISVGNPSPPREDDTMISMLGGGHVRRRSIGSSFEASPCVRVEKREKRKYSEFAEMRRAGVVDYDETDASPNKARHIRQESVGSSVSSESSKFGENRMSLAQMGLLKRNSLEDSALSAEGEDDYTTHSFRSPVFTRPTPMTRSRIRPVVTVSQPPDTTPPLSSSESQSGGSQSSIDIERLKVLLQTATAGTHSSNTRARARGQGHRRRPSQVSRSSVIGTIQEENPGLSNSPPSNNRSPNRDSLDGASSCPPSPLDPPPTAEPSVDVVEWDDERMVTGLRKYYALKDEVHDTIFHSKMAWLDTPFSMHALQTFVPPSDPAGMKALLEHSQKYYIPLASDLRPRRIRSRTSSMNRPSPYSRSARPVNQSLSSSSSYSRNSSVDQSSSFDRSRALQQVSISQSLNSPAPALAAFTPFSPLVLDLPNSEENISVPQSVIKPHVRPRVGSAARRTALGWTKRKTPKKTEGKSINSNKENEAHGLLTSPTESLRISRPRPRGRVATPAARTSRPPSLRV